MTIRVVLVDDQTLVRAGFRSLLDFTPDIEVVGEASDGQEALLAIKAKLPDVVLMDIRMPLLDGVEATRLIASDPMLSKVRILVLTTFELDEYVFDSLRAGASGFLLKDVEPEDLRSAIRVVAGGDSLLAPRVTSRLIANYVASKQYAVAPSAKLTSITEREREVMTLVGTGLSNKEIAQRLFISVATAKTHVSRAMLKLNARDRAQLVVLAYEWGIVTPGSSTCP
jgi:DNA-binding NarL/FixJ family response regulator